VSTFILVFNPPRRLMRLIDDASSPNYYGSVVLDSSRTLLSSTRNDSLPVMRDMLKLSALIHTTTLGPHLIAQIIQSPARTYCSERALLSAFAL